MAQGRQQNNGSRQRCAQSAAAKAPAEPPKAVCAQLEQMNRKLAAASAEILRYQTRLFACERQMAALRQENADLLRRMDALRTIDRAKYLLMQYLGMSEAQAHRYIERQAMNLRVSKKVIAEHIRKTYDN